MVHLSSCSTQPLICTPSMDCRHQCSSIPTKHYFVFSSLKPSLAIQPLPWKHVTQDVGLRKHPPWCYHSSCLQTCCSSVSGHCVVHSCKPSSHTAALAFQIPFFCFCCSASYENQVCSCPQLISLLRSQSPFPPCSTRKTNVPMLYQFLISIKESQNKESRKQ